MTPALVGVENHRKQTFGTTPLKVSASRHRAPFPQSLQPTTRDVHCINAYMLQPLLRGDVRVRWMQL